MIKRRHFLHNTIWTSNGVLTFRYPIGWITSGLLLIVFLWLLNTAAVPSPTPPLDRPNILFCIADDWSLHAGVYGDAVVKTPHIDRIASSGIKFKNAFCAAPSCSPSRAAILTGRYPHQLDEGGNLWGTLPKKYPNYSDLLEKSGYYVGIEGKGWGPGKYEVGGYAQNPAGKSYKNFTDFWHNKPKNQPFCYWFGSHDPHRPYEKGQGKAAGLDPTQVKVPAWLPDTPEIREDIVDYYFEIQRFDRELGEIVEKLRQSGELSNTLIVITGDNGMPFPRAKANVYDGGSNVPLIICWENQLKAQPKIEETLVSLVDLAPTFLESAKLPIPLEMRGKSLLPYLTKKTKSHRSEVFLERERHANVRRDNQSYPIRAIRTKDFLYIKNLQPLLYPGGDPELWFAVGEYGDVDGSPSKTLILSDTLKFQPYFQLAFAKRPAEELYDLRIDPFQLKNVANQAPYGKVQKALFKKINDWQKSTQDPRFTGGDPFSTYPYYGGAVKKDSK
ncbi:sulfatase [Haliscomenobacter hydrossis]|uniref:N-sulfoglucosamine sulfohydrolase n=1 Tax=Haliscomenobacter hydrossis (strain ATCC 27775 / DSM 1100 / LMG 10767 / O) TaxID=760192 RepID=F4L8B6_HALH1|nr:sulfatase [Haliscomenobacter hydrossis]AEE54624.1 N-sulfoglucosamine sulfohydrolase [Haliscomenobacter hydrossis DSM 1100]